MRTLKISLLVFILSINVSAQWFQQNSGTNGDLLNVFFINSDFGWIGSTEGKIFKTTDGGNSWNLYSTGSNKDIFAIHFINQDTGWCVSSTYWGNGEGDIYKTIDGGLTWEEKFSFTTILESIYFINENVGWATGTAYFIGGQCLISTDGGDNWSASYTFGNPIRPRDIYFKDENKGIIVGGENPGRIYKTIDGGYSWEETLIGHWFQDVSFSDPLHGIAVGWHNSYARTTNGGESWEAFQIGHYASAYGVSNYYPKCWIIIGSPNYILNTSDYGDKWFPQLKIEGIHLSGICFVNDTVGWVVGFQGTVLKTINGGIPNVGTPQVPILLLPDDRDTLETSNVYFDWEEIEYSAYQLQVSSDTLFSNIVIDIRSIQNFWDTQLNTFQKYYWRLRSENINGYSDWASPRCFYTGGISGIENEEEIFNFSLSQNYPNPFNPVTKIKFEIPGQARNDIALVTLKVYDILGREVAALVNEEKPAGEYEVEFDGNGLPSGIYFYQLKAGDPSTSSGQGFVATKKMILIK